MAKPYELLVTVEEIALGGALRKIRDVAGVIGVDLNLGLAKPGADAEALASAAAELRSNGSTDRIIRYLAEHGPTKRSVIRHALGLSESQINSRLQALLQKGVINSPTKAMYGLVAMPTGEVVQPTLALPAPTGIEKTSHGRVPQGQGAILLLALLYRHRPSMPRQDLGKAMIGAGVPQKSISAMLGRAIRDKLVKRTGSGNNSTIELTAKGQQHAEHANG